MKTLLALILCLFFSSVFSLNIFEDHLSKKDYERIALDSSYGEASDVLEKYKNDSKGRPPLHAAIECQDFEGAHLLIEHGADVNEENDGLLPLDRALLLSDRKVMALVEKLLEKGATSKHLTNPSDLSSHANQITENILAHLTLNHALTQEFKDTLQSIAMNHLIDRTKEARQEAKVTSQSSKEDRSITTSNIVEILIAYGNNPYQWPAICYAASLGQKEIIENLLSYGANINSECEEGSVLEIALPHKNLSLIQFLCNKGAKMTPNFLLKTASLEFFEAFTWYLASDYPLPENSGEIIHMLIEKKQPMQYIEALIKKGADLSYEHMGKTLLFSATDRQEEKLLKLLIEKNAPFFGTSTDPACNPLVLAISKNRNDLVAPLIEHFPKECSETLKTHTKAIWTELFNFYHLDLIRQLVDLELPLDTNINPELPAIGYSTPLQKAILEENLELVGFLLENDASINNKGSFIKTPLKMAIEKEARAIIELLIRKGARIEDF